MHLPTCPQPNSLISLEALLQRQCTCTWINLAPFYAHVLLHCRRPPCRRHKGHSASCPLLLQRRRRHPQGPCKRSRYCLLAPVRVRGVLGGCPSPPTVCRRICRQLCRKIGLANVTALKDVCRSKRPWSAPRKRLRFPTSYRTSMRSCRNRPRWTCCAACDASRWQCRRWAAGSAHGLCATRASRSAFFCQLFKTLQSRLSSHAGVWWCN